MVSSFSINRLNRRLCLTSFINVLKWIYRVDSSNWYFFTIQTKHGLEIADMKVMRMIYTMVGWTST